VPTRGSSPGSRSSQLSHIPPKLHFFDFSTIAGLPAQGNPDIYFHAHILYIPQFVLSEFQLLDTMGRSAIEWKKGQNHQDLTNLKPGTYILQGPHYRKTWIKIN